MAQRKWLKVGAAAVLSAGMLAACGGNEDEPQMEQETDVLPGNEEDDTDTDTDIDTDMDTETDTDTDTDTDMDTDEDTED